MIFWRLGQSQWLCGNRSLRRGGLQTHDAQLGLRGVPSPATSGVPSGRGGVYGVLEAGLLWVVARMVAGSPLAKARFGSCEGSIVCSSSSPRGAGGGGEAGLAWFLQLSWCGWMVACVMRVSSSAAAGMF